MVIRQQEQSSHLAGDVFMFTHRDLVEFPQEQMAKLWLVVGW